MTGRSVGAVLIRRPKLSGQRRKSTINSNPSASLSSSVGSSKAAKD